jgi:predicted nucleic acid-binding protein
VTFVDTPALLTYLDRDAARHEEVVASSIRVFQEGRALTHNCVLVETEALTHRRLGARVARRLLEDVVPILEIVWVDARLHEAAAAAHLRGNRQSSARSRLPAATRRARARRCTPRPAFPRLR